jgi:hypothetical protein
VSAAVWLLYLAALAWLATGVIAILTHGDLTEVYRQLYADDPQQQGTEEASAIAGTSLMVIQAVLFGAGLIVLGAFNARGPNAARITTWAVGGFAACCAGYNTIGIVLSDALAGSMPSDVAGVDLAELQRLMDELMPSWAVPARLVAAGVQLVALLVAIVLLMLPAANRFFRGKQPPPWEPPVPAYPPMNLPPQ